MSQRKFIFAAFLGQPVVPLLRLLSRQPIVLDQFISIFDTLCNDRKAISPSSVIGRMARKLDRWSCQEAALVLVDTKAQGDFIAAEFGIPAQKIRVLPVGADETTFRPVPRRSTGAARHVFYYSSGLPLHGLEVVVSAARLLEPSGIRFRIAGLRPSKQLSTNIEALGWVPETTLAKEIDAADLCLAGHFAVNAKGQRVVPGKAYQFIAKARPVVLTHGEGNEEIFTPGKDAIFCSPGSPEDLADTVRRALADPQLLGAVAKAGRATFERVASEETLARKLGEYLAELDLETRASHLSVRKPSPSTA